LQAEVKKTDTFFKGVCHKAWDGANLLPGKKETKMTNQLPRENLVPVVRLLHTGYPQQTKTNHHHKSCTFGTPVIQTLKLKKPITLPTLGVLL
jgi:hypothetical protein